MGALADLGPLLVYFVAFALGALAYYIAKAVQHGISFLPFGIGADISGAIEAAIVAPMKAVMENSDAEIAKGLSVLAGSLATWLSLTLLPQIGMKKALEYLWNVALRPLIHAISDPVRDLAREAVAKAEELPGVISREVGAARAWATTEADRAIHAAETTAIRLAQTAEHAAERYADEAVSKLRAAEESAIGEALSVAHVAETDAKAAYAQAASLAESLVAPVGAEVSQLDAYIKSLGLTSIVAAVPALALLVQTIASESGLENAECRSKVKGICGTDPSAWEGLLAGLAFTAVALDWKAMARLAADGAILAAQAAKTIA